MIVIVSFFKISFLGSQGFTRVPERARGVFLMALNGLGSLCARGEAVRTTSTSDVQQVYMAALAHGAAVIPHCLVSITNPLASARLSAGAAQRSRKRGSHHEAKSGLAKEPRA